MRPALILSFAFLCPALPGGVPVQAPPAQQASLDEKTFDGTIVEVTTMMPHRQGVHVTLDTVDGRRTVRLGPSAFLESHGLKLQKGDKVTVTARPSRPDGEWIAQEILKGDKHVTLRDAKGLPLWRMGGGMMKGK